MKTLSIRWKLVLPIMTMVAVAASLLVLLYHSRTRAQLLRQLERTLMTKCEEVQAVLGSGATREELGAFVEVETSCISTPYDYFYEIKDAEGEILLASRNLAGRGLVACAGTLGEELATLPHPRRSGEFVRVHSEPLVAGAAGWNAPRLSVAVSLAPLEPMLKEDLIQSLVASAGGLLALFMTLWMVVGRTLQRVAAITRRASTITSTNLRERLPMNGSGDELDELSRVFNEMLAGLGRSLEQMDAFTSDAAHQLRTPLTRVRGELDLVLRNGNGLSEAARVRLGEAREELERLARTCSRLLLLARLDRGAIEADLLSEEVDLGGLVEDLVEQVGPLADQRGVKLRCDRCQDVLVHGSKALLVEALLNLLDNALRASAHGKTIEVSLRRSADQAIVTVADQGPGIPEHLREQVFRRFFRHARAGDGGTGLGLAIVRGIARAHGGDVRIETSRWGGAALVLALPLGRRKLIGFSSESQPTLNRAG